MEIDTLNSPSSTGVKTFLRQPITFPKQPPFPQDPSQVGGWFRKYAYGYNAEQREWIEESDRRELIRDTQIAVSKHLCKRFIHSHKNRKAKR
jgi:hypothetical protein